MEDSKDNVKNLSLIRQIGYGIGEEGLMVMKRRL